jgi:hypothetical protein
VIFYYTVIGSFTLKLKEFFKRPRIVKKVIKPILIRRYWLAIKIVPGKEDFREIENQYIIEHVKNF